MNRPVCFTCAKDKNTIQHIKTGRSYCVQCYKAGMFLQNYRLVETEDPEFKLALFKKQQKLGNFVSRRIAEEVLFFYVGKPKEE